MFLPTRIIGLCLLQNEICPLFLNRHVLKYILGRSVAWHDLAFFDPVMFESLRSLVTESESKDGSLMIPALDLTFSVELCAEEVSLCRGQGSALLGGGALGVEWFVMKWLLFQESEGVAILKTFSSWGGWSFEVGRGLMKWLLFQGNGGVAFLKTGFCL